MSSQDRISIAHHEAGHAVIGRVLGLVCGYATIKPDEDSAGHAISEDPWHVLGTWEARGKYREIASVMRGRIIAYMAGHEAEVECLGSSPGGDGDDRRQIVWMIDSECPRFDVEKGEPRLRRATRALVRRHRQKIECVAAALLQHETLAADEIDAIVKDGA